MSETNVDQQTLPSFEKHKIPSIPCKNDGLSESKSKPKKEQEVNSNTKHSFHQPKMNATSLYVTTTRIVLKVDPKKPESWEDLYRLIPYLRNSLCCVVCSTLLRSPLTPANGRCQHHVCTDCQFGKKKIKPQCLHCKDGVEYKKNRSLKILIQLYKQLCIHLLNSPIHNCLHQQAHRGLGIERGATNLIKIIEEGALLKDDFEHQGGLPKSAYSILPCIYTNTRCPENAVKVPQVHQEDQLGQGISPKKKSSLYVVNPGAGNKITIKRKMKEGGEKSVFKKPCAKQKKGCRCGNATANPGKLTCCGQRCPCYIDQKACIDCKCKGCRNPHTPDGKKIIRQYVPQTPLLIPPVERSTSQIKVLRPVVTPSTSKQIVHEGLREDPSFAEENVIFDINGKYNLFSNNSIAPTEFLEVFRDPGNELDKLSLSDEEPFEIEVV